MGVGNYYLNDAKTVYIDQGQILGDESDGMFEDVYLVEESLIPMIGTALPASFKLLPRNNRKWLDRDRLLIAESGLHRISLVGWESYFAINVEVIKGQVASPLGRHQLDRIARGIFDALVVQGLDLRVRSCAWTSSPYQPVQVLAA